MSIEHQPQLRVHIRWMIRRDMPEVLEIERQSFEFPWFEEDFIRCLRGRNCIGMVAEHAERVVGFMIYALHKTRLHILNFAVAADVRRRGIGTGLLHLALGCLVALHGAAAARDAAYGVFADFSLDWRDRIGLDSIAAVRDILDAKLDKLAPTLEPVPCRSVDASAILGNDGPKQRPPPSAALRN